MKLIKTQLNPKPRSIRRLFLLVVGELPKTLAYELAIEERQAELTLIENHESDT